MSKEEARLVAAAALRDLNHAFVAHDAETPALEALTAVARAQTDHLMAAPGRDRLTLMQTPPGGGGGGEPDAPRPRRRLRRRRGGGARRAAARVRRRSGPRARRDRRRRV